MIALILSLFLAMAQPAQDDARQLTMNFIGAETSKCWTLDRSDKKDVVSVSATGLGFYATAIAVEKKLISPASAELFIRRGFDNMLEINKGNHGWLYHFIDPNGKPVYAKHVSSIDTCIFYLSAEAAAKRLKDKTLLEYIVSKKNLIDIDFMLNKKTGLFRHGFVWNGDEPDYLGYEWDTRSEGVLLYKYFEKDFHPKECDYGLPLFVYYYPLAFYNNPDGVTHLGAAINWQISKYKKFGITATDGPKRYVVYDPEIISPLSVYSCNKFFPIASEAMLKELGVSRLTTSMTVDKKWISQTRILIEDGILLLLLTQQDGSPK